MHYPYYGDQALQSRVNSYFDHDKPWYASDYVFVRYDGRRWTGSGDSVFNCDSGKSCYDGHDGYDLNMRFEPVLSAASGQVIRAGWYNALNHSTSFGLWVAINHGNGYMNVYGHLSALIVSVGDHVGTQWQIGTSGTTGSSTGPHLHFGTYYYPAWHPTDPSGWSGRYSDPNVVADYNLWATGTNDTPVPLLSAKGNHPYPGAILVNDDSTSGWKSTGSWHKARSGTDINGQMHWVGTTSGAGNASATWQPQLPADGYYEVGVYVNDKHASSGWAPYTIYSADPKKPGVEVRHHIRLDQEHIGEFQSPFGGVNTGSQWIGLGTYYFRDNRPGRVVLDNATGENGLQLSADAVEFAPLAPLTYGFTVTEDTTPTQMAPGSTMNVQLTLQNTSSFLWQARGSTAVRLVYNWVDSQQHMFSTSQPVELPSKVAINASQVVTIPLQAPAQAGTYTLQWDLVQDARAFSKLGARAYHDSVTIGNTVGEHTN